MKWSFPKVQFLLGFNVISNKNHLSYSYIVFRNGKILRIEKNWKNTKNVRSNLLRCKNYWTKKSRLLAFWCKYIENCQTVMIQFSRLWISLSHHSKRLFTQDVNQFFVKIDLLSITYQLLSTFHKVLLHSRRQLSKTNSPSKKQKQKTKKNK